MTSLKDVPVGPVCSHFPRLLAAEKLSRALWDFHQMGLQYDWDKATTGRQILMESAEAALLAWKEASK